MLTRLLILACLLVPMSAFAQDPTPSPSPGGHGHHGGHHGFSDTERWIEVFEDPARDEWQKPDVVVAMLDLAPGMKVADIGAGTGYFSRRFAACVGPGGEVLALDLEPGLLEYADRKAKEQGLTAHRTRVAKADDPELAPASQDRIFMADVLHHIEPRGPYLEKLVKALKPGGWLVNVDFVHDRETPVGPPLAMRLDAAAIAKELEDLGLQVEQVDVLPYQYVLIGRKPIDG